MKNRYLASAMLTTIDDAIRPKRQYLETGVFVKPEDSILKLSVQQTSNGSFGKADLLCSNNEKRPFH